MQRVLRKQPSPAQATDQLKNLPEMATHATLTKRVEKPTLQTSPKQRLDLNDSAASKGVGCVTIGAFLVKPIHVTEVLNHDPAFVANLTIYAAFRSATSNRLLFKIYRRPNET